MLGMGAQVRHGNIQGEFIGSQFVLETVQDSSTRQHDVLWGIQNERVDVCQSLAFWADHLTQDT